MSSMYANPLLIGGISFEYLFLLDQRLREQAQLPRQKKVEIFGEAVEGVFNELFMHSVFTKARIYPDDALRQIFYEATQSPSLRITQESFAKFFGIVSMSFKAHMVRIAYKADLIALINNQVRELKNMLADYNEKVTLELVDGFRERLINWLKDLSYGEFSRLIDTIINATRVYRTPMTLLVDRKVQAPNSNLVLPVGGRTIDNLGRCVLFDGDGKEVVSYDLPIAGRRLRDPAYIVGENIYKPRGAHARMSDDEFYVRALRDAYSDTEEEIEFGGKMLDEVDEEGEDMTRNTSRSKRKKSSKSRRRRHREKRKEHDKAQMEKSSSTWAPVLEGQS